MGDNMTPEQRARCMSMVRGKDTKPELVVRRMLHLMGYRFRLHRRDLPGTPDIVLPRHAKIVEVRGCFWHMHHCRFGKAVPKTNAEFWRMKREGNAERDRRNLRKLRRLGWSVLVVWECQTVDPERLRRRLAAFMDG